MSNFSCYYHPSFLLYDEKIENLLGHYNTGVTNNYFEIRKGVCVTTVMPDIYSVSLLFYFLCLKIYLIQPKDIESTAFDKTTRTLYFSSSNNTGMYFSTYQPATNTISTVVSDPLLNLVSL